MLRNTIICVLSAMTAVSCSNKEHLPVSGGRTQLPVALTSADAGQDLYVDEVTGYRFENGTLKEVLTASYSAQEHRYVFNPESLSGTLFILTGAGNAGALQGVKAGTLSIDGFLSMEATVEEMISGGMAMSGRMDLSPDTDASVLMVRSLARIDISALEAGVKVLGVKISNLAEKGYLVHGDRFHAPGNPPLYDFSKSWEGAPMENASGTLLYAVEQSGAGITAEIMAEVDGGIHIFETVFPERILRNTVYTVTVHGNGASVTSDVSPGGWEYGGTLGTAPSARGLIDVENSEFPEGVFCSEGRDTLYVPYKGADFSLALLSAADASLAVHGTSDGSSVNLAEGYADGAGQASGAVLSVSGRMKYPNEPERHVYVDVYEGGQNTGRVVVVFEPCPYRVEGRVSLEGTGVCDFGEYVEGEMGVLSVPSGCSAVCEFDDGESAWMKLSEVSGSNSQIRSYRILAGWKPNDPTADGRPQQGRIVVTGVDGVSRDEYTVIRRNWGLPVVRIGDTWWCKYNLKGNVKSFEDQVTVDEDPALDGNLMDVLLSLPAESLLEVMGDQYQGGNDQGLPLVYDGTHFYYEGMTSSGKEFVVGMAPVGYQLPVKEDYLVFTEDSSEESNGSVIFSLGGVGTRSYTNSDGRQVTSVIKERENVTFLGGNYGPLEFYDFEIDGSHIVLYGLGHQYNINNSAISKLYVVLATVGEGMKAWYIEGYPSSSNKNYFKYASQNNTKTRTIRCIKSPVEYVYE